MNAGALHGAFTKAITVFTDDPVRPNLVLQLKGELKTALVADPAAAAFGLVVEGSEAQERRIRLTAAPGSKVAATLPPQPAGRRFQYALEVKRPGEEYELVIRLVPPFTVGPANESVVLLLDHPKQKSLEVRASGTVAPRLALEPAALQMQEVPAGQPFRGEVRLVNRGAATLKVLEAVADAPEVSVALVETVPGRNFTVRVEAPGDYVPPAGGARVRVKTDDAKTPELAFTLLPRPQPRPSPVLLLGKPAPAFSLSTVAGRALSNATVRQEVTLLDFFAVDCPHCKRQIPKLVALAKTYAGKPVRLVLVTQKMRGEFTPDQVREALAASGVDPGSVEFAVEMTNATGTKFQVTSYPALLVVGRDGTVGGVVMGNAPDLENQVKTILARLLGEPPPAPKGPAAATDTAH